MTLLDKPATPADAVAASAKAAERVYRRDETSSVLRLSESEAEIVANDEIDLSGNEPTIVNMGPVHPSTHGVLRLMLEMQGEQVLRSKPVIGYLHTGMEKTGEQLTYEAPPRAQWIRTMMCELNRISSHMLYQATNGMDVGAVSMMLYGNRLREETLRPGGVAADLPDGWREDISDLLDMLPPMLDEFDELLTGQPIFKERLQGVGAINADECYALGITGPILRSCGQAVDLRRDMPYLKYDEVDFDVIVGSYGDCFDRYAIRLAEAHESIRIVRQCIEKMPPGDYRLQDKKVTPPPRARIDESMEALIHHFKIFTEGFKVPEGEVYVGIESPRGPQFRQHPSHASHDEQLSCR